MVSPERSTKASVPVMKTRFPGLATSTVDRGRALVHPHGLARQRRARMKPDTRHRGGYYSPAEETAHAVTHGLGCLLAAAGLVILVVQAVRRDEPWEVVGAAVFGATMVLLY